MVTIEVEGKEIGYLEFSWCSLEVAVIPEGVESIGQLAFWESDRLERVHLPASLRFFGHCAFDECDRLEAFEVDDGNETFASVDGVLYTRDMSKLVRFPPGRRGSYVVPDGVECIGDGAFASSALESITLPDSLSSVERHAFSGCRNIESIRIPDGVKSIGNCAFSGCHMLEDVVLPDGLESIGDFMFYECSGLKRIAVPEGVRTIEERAFGACENLESVVLPRSLKCIGYCAFEFCDNLRRILIPAGVEAISEYAFNWSGLERVDLDGESDSFVSMDGVLYDRDDGELYRILP